MTGRCINRTTGSSLFGATRMTLVLAIAAATFLSLTAATPGHAGGINSSRFQLPVGSFEVSKAEPIAYANETVELVHAGSRPGTNSAIVTSIVSKDDAGPTLPAARVLFEAAYSFEAVAMDATTGLVVAWDATQRRVLAKTTHSDGRIGAEVVVSPSLGQNASQLVVAGLGNGLAMAAWTETVDGKIQLVAHSISSTGEVGPRIILSEVYESWTDDVGAHGGHLWGPEIDGHGDGTGSIVWQDADCHSSNCFIAVESARVSASAVVSSQQVVPRTHMWLNYSISASPTGSLDVVWSEKMYWQWRTYLVRVEADGGLSAPVVSCPHNVGEQPVERRQCLYSSNGWSYAAYENFGFDSRPDGGGTIVRSANGSMEHFGVSENGIASRPRRFADFPNPNSIGVIDGGPGAAFGVWAHNAGTGVRASAIGPYGPYGTESGWTDGNYQAANISKVADSPAEPEHVYAWAAWSSSTSNSIRLVRLVPTAIDKDSGFTLGLTEMPSVLSLGDSVSSGEGLGYGIEWDYADRHWRASDGTTTDEWLGEREFDNVTEPGEQCHRHAGAYPYGLARLMDSSLTHLACSGASAQAGVLEPWNPPGGDNSRTDAQLPENSSESAVRIRRPALITISLGANDIDFGDWVHQCYTADCGSDFDEEQIVKPTLFVQKTELDRTLTRIDDHWEATPEHPKPVVAILNYYDPFPAKYPDPNSCADIKPSPFGGGWGIAPAGSLSSAEMDFLRKNLGRLNKNIAEVARAHKAILVDVNSDSTSSAGVLSAHRWCSADPWFFGPSILRGWDGIDKEVAEMAPFHPTGDGHDQIAELAMAAVTGTKRVSSGDSRSFFEEAGRLLGTVFIRNATAAGLVRLGVSKLQSFFFPENLVRRAGRSVGPEAQLPPGIPDPPGFVVGQVLDYTSTAETTTPAILTIPTPEDYTSVIRFDGTEWLSVPATRVGDSLQFALSESATVAIGKQAAPIVASIAHSDPGTAPTNVTFDATGSSYEAGTAPTFSWNFGDGSNAIGDVVAHQYETGGVFAVELVARSDQGVVSRATADVVIESPIPTLTVDWPTNVIAGEPASFIAEATTGDGSDPVVGWQFESATAEAGLSVTKSFHVPGPMRVIATVSNRSGEIATVSETVNVNAPIRDGAGPSPAEALDLSLIPARNTKRSIAARRKIEVKCILSQPTSCRVEAMIRLKDAKRLRITGRRIGNAVRIAVGTVRMQQAGTANLRLVVSRAIARAVGRSRKPIVIQLRGKAETADSVAVAQAQIKLAR